MLDAHSCNPYFSGIMVRSKAILVVAFLYCELDRRYLSSYCRSYVQGNREAWHLVQGREPLSCGVSYSSTHGHYSCVWLELQHPCAGRRQPCISLLAGSRILHQSSYRIGFEGSRRKNLQICKHRSKIQFRRKVSDLMLFHRSMSCKDGMSPRRLTHAHGSVACVYVCFV